jgi:hypothetical protein
MLESEAINIMKELKEVITCGLLTIGKIIR